MMLHISICLQDNCVNFRNDNNSTTTQAYAAVTDQEQVKMYATLTK